MAIKLVDDCIDSNVSLPNSLALMSVGRFETKNNSFVTKQAADPILSKEMLHDQALLYAPNKLEEADAGELKLNNFHTLFHW